MASPSSNPLLSTADFGSPRSHAGMQLASPSGLPSSNNMVASINSLTEKMKALEMPDRLASFQEGMDARAWLGQFEVLAHGKGWNTSPKMAATLPLYFHINVSSDWFVHLPDDTKRSYDRLCGAFLDEYNPRAAQQWELENALRVRKQRPGENLRTFLRDIRRQGSHIGLNDGQMVDIALHNMNPTARALVPGRPSSIEEILDTSVGRGEVQATSGGIDAQQYQQLLDLLSQQSAQISSLEGKLEGATSKRHGSDRPPPPTQRREGQHYEQYRQQPRSRGQQHWNSPAPRHGCNRCGGECPDFVHCRARGSVCHYCHVPNHWACVCERKRADQQAKRAGNTGARYQNGQTRPARRF